MSDYSEEKIRFQVIAGLRAEPWQVEMEEIDYGEKCGVFYRGPQGIKRAMVEARGKTENQIAFALLAMLMNNQEYKVIGVGNHAAIIPTVLPEANALGEIQLPLTPIKSPYEGKGGRHPSSCTCSKHKALDGQQAV